MPHGITMGTDYGGNMIGIRGTSVLRRPEGTVEQAHI